MKQQLPHFHISKDVFDKAIGRHPLSNGIPQMIERLKMRKLSHRKLRQILRNPQSCQEHKIYAASELERRACRSVSILKIAFAVLVLIAFYLLTTP